MVSTGERRGEGERAVGGDREIVAAVVLEHQAGAGEPGHRAPDGVGRKRLVRARHENTGDVRRSHHSRCGGDGTGLFGRLARHRDRVGTAGLERSGEGERAGHLDGERVPAVVAQDQSRGGQPADGPADGERRGHGALVVSAAGQVRVARGFRAARLARAATLLVRSHAQTPGPAQRDEHRDDRDLPRASRCSHRASRKAARKVVRPTASREWQDRKANAGRGGVRNRTTG